MNKVDVIEKMAKEAKGPKVAAGRALDAFIEGVRKGLQIGIFSPKPFFAFNGPVHGQKMQ